MFVLLLVLFAFLGFKLCSNCPVGVLGVVDIYVKVFGVLKDLLADSRRHRADELSVFVFADTVRCLTVLRPRKVCYDRTVSASGATVDMRRPSVTGGQGMRAALLSVLSCGGYPKARTSNISGIICGQNTLNKEL